MRILFLLFFVSIIGCAQPSQQEKAVTTETIPEIEPGAWQMEEYLPLLKGKRVGLVVNHSSTLRDKHLLDTLLNLGVELVNVPKVFAPEHGFSGKADAGEDVASEKRARYELISLFGEKRKPDLEDLDGLDVVIFDMQDVGVRFYTYISTMHYVMVVCAQRSIPFIVLDRPNPNGSYVDGPFLKKGQESFVGLHPIPIVHGLTIGELAKMINGEGWLGNGLTCDLTVIPVKNWTHDMPYSLPIKPSPNLPNDMSIALYPTICLFEGTIVSVGRGTDSPFQQIGHPAYPDKTYSFVPMPAEGAKNPFHEGNTCYGIDFSKSEIQYQFDIAPLIDFYTKMGKPKNFFTPYIKNLAGDIDDQIKAGMTAEQIRASWQPELDTFKEMREKYLMYK
jgi:uncharacterized protein YbbC (DUF1343 family)